MKIVVGLVLLLLQALAWLLAVGGVGKLHDDCTGDKCAETYRSSWWAIFFQLFVLIATGITVLAGGLESARIPVIAFLVLSTVELMDQAEVALKIKDADIQGMSESAVDSAAGGFVWMSLVNFVMIILIGVSSPPNVQWLKGAAGKLRARHGEQGAAAGQGAPGVDGAPTAPPVVVDLKAMDQGVQPQGPATLPVMQVGGEKVDGGAGEP